ncbi:unnamed protein product [Boreogadus saida]
MPTGRQEVTAAVSQQTTRGRLLQQSAQSEELLAGKKEALDHLELLDAQLKFRPGVIRLCAICGFPIILTPTPLPNLTQPPLSPHHNHYQHQMHRYPNTTSTSAPRTIITITTTTTFTTATTVKTTTTIIMTTIIKTTIIKTTITTITTTPTIIITTTPSPP